MGSILQSPTTANLTVGRPCPSWHMANTCVAEAVEALRPDSIRIIAPTLPNGRAATVHMTLSDPTGDSAIFEWLDGKLVIHHGKEYKVMTNLSAIGGT